MSLRAGLALPLLLAATLAGCQLLARFELGDLDPSPDAGRDGDADPDGDSRVDPDAEADPDASGDADADRDVEAGPGPITVVATELLFTTERLCDFDGDGSLDNAVADLGSPSSDYLVMAMNGVLAGHVRDGLRLVIHLPRVDEVAGPSDPGTVLVVFTARDADDPDDPSDDFSGEEPFTAKARCLDACGEPRFFFLDAHLVAGELLATGGYAPLPVSVERFVPAEQASLFGVVEPGGTGAEIRGCGLLAIPDLGELPSMLAETDLTMLENLLAGGAAVGVPGIPGLLPNVDLDGDGLERFELDETGHIVACIDGDTTRFEGRDCWQDPRMADAFAASTSMSFTGAAFAGRDPGWEHWVEGTCEAPPEESLFDPR